MSQIHIFLAFSLRVKSGLLTILVLRRWNPTQLFLFRFPHSHRSLNQTISPPTSSYSFAQATAMIISALLCLNKSSLFAKTLHPATDAQWFHLFRDIPYSVRLELILSLLSTILSPPFVLASS